MIFKASSNSILRLEISIFIFKLYCLRKKSFWIKFNSWNLQSEISFEYKIPAIVSTQILNVYEYFKIMYMKQIQMFQFNQILDFRSWIQFEYWVQKIRS